MKALAVLLKSIQNIQIIIITEPKTDVRVKIA